MNVPQYEMLVT